MAGYLGSVPVPQATQHRESFTCTEGQTTFNTAGYTPQFVDVYLNGSHLSPADFTASNGSDVVLGVAASADDVCDIISYTPFEVADATFTGDFAVIGDTVTFTSANSTDPRVIIKNTTNDANAAVLNFIKDKGAAGADADSIGSIFFTGDNDAQEQTLFGRVNGLIADASNGAEGGKIQLQIATHDGEMKTGFEIVDGNAEDEIDVNIGQGTDSTTTVAGDLVVTTDLDVDGTTNLDIVDIDGAVNMASTLAFNVASSYASAISIRQAANAMIFSGGTGGYYFNRHDNSATDLAIAGDGSLSTPTAGTSNVRFGVNAGNSIASGGNLNTIVGDEAGTAVSTGDQNTLIGYRAGTAVNTSVNNVAVGMDAMLTNSTGDNNIAVGREALKRLTTSNENVAVGSETLKETTTGTKNVAMGHTAGQFALTADSSTFVGHSAGKGINNTKLTGNLNTAVGYEAGTKLQGTAQNNTALGSGSLASLTTGDGNVAVGVASGAQGAMINVTTEDNRAIFGHATITNSYVEVDWTVTSDARDKMNFAEVPHGLSFVNDLQPIKFDFKKSRDDATPHGNTKYGFKAQDILALEGENPIIIDNEFEDKLKITNSHLMPVLVKAIQELSTALDAALARIAVLEG